MPSNFACIIFVNAEQLIYPFEGLVKSCESVLSLMHM